MATVSEWNPFGVALDITATGSNVVRTSATQFTVKVNASWETYYEGAQTNYGMTASSGGGSVNLNTSGTKSSSGSGSFTGTYSIDKNVSATKTITVTFKNYIEDWQGNVTESKTNTVRFNVDVPAWTSYTVSYNANGGSEPPSSQTKWKDQTLTLSSDKPTRTGYTFKGWGTSASDTTVDYSAGGSYTANASDTLYAIWDANSYTYNIVYKSSSGTQLGTATIAKDYGTTNTISPKSFTGYTSPSSQSIKWDSISEKTITFTYTPITYNVTISCNGGSGVNSRTYTVETATFSLGTPTRTGYTFNGWTGSNGTTAQKTVSISKGSTGDKSYTAQWSENVLTVHYYSNYATSAFDGALNAVGADKNVEVYTSSIYYDNDYSAYGLANYSTSGGAAYMTRTGYTPTGYWGTSTNGGTLIGENDKSYTTGQSLAKALGKDLSSGNASINVYAQWTENKLIINYYSNKADYGTLEGDVLNVSGDTNVLVHTQEFLYDNKYDNGLSDVQNTSYLYLSRVGYNPTGYWGTLEDGGTLVHQNTSFATGQDLALALGVSIASQNVSVEIYPQWVPSGVVYVDNGTKLEAYLPYIDNGSSWDLYLVYIDNGTDWDIIS